MQGSNVGKGFQEILGELDDIIYRDAGDNEIGNLNLDEYCFQSIVQSVMKNKSVTVE